MTKTERARAESFLRDLARVCVVHGANVDGYISSRGFGGPWALDASSLGRAVIYEDDSLDAATVARGEADASEPPF